MSERPPTFLELAIEATTSTRQGYNLLAPRFDLTPYATPKPMIEACCRRIDELLPLAGAGVGLDLGCGTGEGALGLAASCSKVVGYDFSSSMLEQAMAKVNRAGVGDRISFWECDLKTVELGQAVYDRVVSFGVWGHILSPWRRSLIGKIGRSLKPGGVFFTVSADPLKPWNFHWWRAAAFDTAMRLRNLLIKDRFDMYYLLNDSLTLKKLFEEETDCSVRVEPVPEKPHPFLSLVMACKEH